MSDLLTVPGLNVQEASSLAGTGNVLLHALLQSRAALKNK